MSSKINFPASRKEPFAPAGRVSLGHDSGRTRYVWLVMVGGSA